MDGKTGFLISEKDIKALADRIMYLIEDPEDRIRMGRTEHKFVQQDYDIKELNQRLLSIYEEVINDNRDSLPLLSRPYRLHPTTSQTQKSYRLTGARFIGSNLGQARETDRITNSQILCIEK